MQKCHLNVLIDSMFLLAWIMYFFTQLLGQTLKISSKVFPILSFVIRSSYTEIHKNVSSVNAYLCQRELAMSEYSDPKRDLQTGLINFWK